MASDRTLQGGPPLQTDTTGSHLSLISSVKEVEKRAVQSSNCPPTIQKGRTGLPLTILLSNRTSTRVMLGQGPECPASAYSHPSLLWTTEITWTMVTHA